MSPQYLKFRAQHETSCKSPRGIDLITRLRLSRTILNVVFVVATFVAGGSSTHAQAPPVEYVDNEFEFAFQVPRDWRFDKLPDQGAVLQPVRVLARHPNKPMYVMATVAQLGKSVTKRQFESSPNRSSIVDGMMELSLEEEDFERNWR